MRRILSITLAALFAVSGTPALAWNYAGHRIIASIAYRQLDEPTRARVAQVLQAHPAYDRLWKDRATNGPDPKLNLFHNAAVWPDDARYEPWKAFGRSEAHYVNFRIMAENQNAILPPLPGENILNSYVAHVRRLSDRSTRPDERANHLA